MMNTAQIMDIKFIKFFLFLCYQCYLYYTMCPIFLGSNVLQMLRIVYH